MRIEDICSHHGALRYDGKKISDGASVFAVKEFTFLFYGSSKDKKSRQVAWALNAYAEYFNPEDYGLQRDGTEITAKVRNCQIFYVPCEDSFADF